MVLKFEMQKKLGSFLGILYLGSFRSIAAIKTYHHKHLLQSPNRPHIPWRFEIHAVCIAMN